MRLSLSVALEILKILYDKPIITAEALGKRCNISTRSVYRYINELTICGIPIQTKTGRRNGGIYIPAEYKTKNNKLAEKEVSLYAD